MPQLPSVSELLIGAQNPASAESRTTPQQVIRKSPSATSVRSETSPRQAEFSLGPQPAPAAHPGSAARHVRVPSASQSFSGPAHVHAPESHFHAHPGSIKDAFVFSAASSGRNSISSVVSDPHGHGPHGQMQAPVFAPDYFSYREGYRSRHASSQSSSPHLQYKPRQESSAGSHTRAPSYHSMPSQESLVTTHSRSPGADHSPTFYAHSRPASFSHASGPGVAYAPAGPTMGPAMGPALGPASGQYGSQMPPMYQQQAPHGAPGGAAPQPLAYYNSATAGSGYPAGFHAGQDASAGVHTGAQASPRTLGSYGGNYGQEHFAHPHPQAQFQMPGMPAPAPMPMQMPAYQMEGMVPGQGMLPRQAHYQYAPPGGSDMQQLATDPNHALINKRCIIKRRTRTGCLTCRKRRIKCDERKPHCFNCERSKKLCLGYEASPSKPGQSRKSSECSPASSPTETEHPSDIAHGQTLSDGHHASHVVKHMPRVSVNDLL